MVILLPAASRLRSDDVCPTPPVIPESEEKQIENLVFEEDAVEECSKKLYDRLNRGYGAEGCLDMSQSQIKGGSIDLTLIAPRLITLTCAHFVVIGPVKGLPSIFMGCETLRSINLSACPNLKVIPEASFAKFVYFETIVIGEANSITSLETRAFNGCKALTVIDLSMMSSLRSIGDSAFTGYWLQKIQSVIFNSGLRTIGEYAFDQCRSLKR